MLELEVGVEQGLATVEAAKTEERREEWRENALLTIVMMAVSYTIILDWMCQGVGEI